MSDAAVEFKPNLEKLKKLQQSASSVVIGGKGVPRRKKKVIHKTASTDDKKLQSTLKKLGVNNIQGIDEVNMFRDSGEVLHFSNPKVQASLQSNIFSISGHAETKPFSEMLPTIMQQLGGLGGLGGANSPYDLQALAKQLSGKMSAAGLGGAAAGGGDDDVPDLVENFDEASKKDDVPELVENK